MQSTHGSPNSETQRDVMFIGQIRFHGHFSKSRTFCNLATFTKNLNSHLKYGAIEDAIHMFEEMSKRKQLDIICYNALISGLVHRERCEEAFIYFKRMKPFISPDSYTLSSLISSNYCLEKSLFCGIQLHGYVIKTSILTGLSVGNSLITLYCRWNKITDARMLFQEMPQRNIVSWTALISGLAHNPGHEHDSLKLFRQMLSNKDHWHRPNGFTFSSIFRVCGKLSLHLQGLMFLSLTMKMGFKLHVHVQNSLIAFFSDCGCLDEAETVFNSISKPDIISCNSFLMGCSHEGRGEDALKLFNEMHIRDDTVKPDSITFLHVLSCCRHCGFLEEGLHIFQNMQREYGIEPREEHLSCLVDMLGRVGRVDWAVKLIAKVGFEFGASVWRTLLGACHVHGKWNELAELAAKKVIEMEPLDSEAHLVLSRVYALSGRWEMMGKTRKMMKNKGVKKKPGLSWIEVGSQVNSFVSGAWDHPKVAEIKGMLMKLSTIMKDITCW